MRLRPMAADLLLPALAATYFLGATDRGQALVKGAWQGVTASPSSKSGKGKGGAKKKATAKKAAGQKGTAQKKSAKKGTVSAKVGAWAGRQLRKGAAAAGRKAKAGVKALHAKAGDAAQGRWEQRTDHAKPISRTPTDTTAETGATSSSTPAPSAQPAVAQPRTAPKETAMSVTELDTPQSDGQLLEGFHQLTEDFKAQAQAISEHAAMLSSARLSSAVTGHINAAAEAAAEGAAHVVRAAQQFCEEHAEAREIASHGIKILGEGEAA